MSQTLLRGLRLLEIVDFSGPLTVSQLARELGVDKATASRMVSACEADGWLVRDDGGHVLIGPRSTLLGQGAAAGVSLRLAEPIIHAVSGVTGMLTQAVGLVGGVGVVLASADPVGAKIPYGLTTSFPLWVSAAGKTIASQLAADDRQRYLPNDPLPVPTDAVSGVAPSAVVQQFRVSLGLGPTPGGYVVQSTTRATSRAQLDAQLDTIVRDGVFIDRAELMPEVSCVAVPWPQPGMPAALVCISTTPQIDRDAALVERALRAAAVSGATRDSIVAAAAAR
ncbi:IclR family transcriptional regulator [Subtercola endophyticus]|uniref:IclR family transcriptional regulator n=1 Tax=Subtercola endophyticus TaxID=2895559 RepID=UPI001E2EAE59|nr:MarR family transcriptional regulator [Subtercola endophyticus]UFS61008.1 MarR family transcriptional regulator [Subtercola endophyticus]